MEFLGYRACEIHAPANKMTGRLRLMVNVPQDLCLLMTTFQKWELHCLGWKIFRALLFVSSWPREQSKSFAYVNCLMCACISEIEQDRWRNGIEMPKRDVEDFGFRSTASMHAAGVWEIRDRCLYKFLARDDLLDGNITVMSYSLVRPSTPVQIWAVCSFYISNAYNGISYDIAQQNTNVFS